MKYINSYLRLLVETLFLFPQLETSGWMKSLASFSLWIPAGAAMGLSAMMPMYFGGGAQQSYDFSQQGSSTQNSFSSSSSYGGMFSNPVSRQPTTESFPGSGMRVGQASYPTATAVPAFPQLGVVSSPSLPGSNATVSASNSASRVVGGNNSGSKPTREELAAKRLAALEKK